MMRLSLWERPARKPSEGVPARQLKDLARRCREQNGSSLKVVLSARVATLLYWPRR
jgi:hypothetical protein